MINAQLWLQNFTENYAQRESRRASNGPHIRGDMVLDWILSFTVLSIAIAQIQNVKTGVTHFSNISLESNAIAISGFCKLFSMIKSTCGHALTEGMTQIRILCP
jgi:hypothetical protein